jgi:ribosomal protein S8
MYYNSGSLVTNHINLALMKNSPKTEIVHTKKVMSYFNSIASTGVVNNFFLVNNKGLKRIRFSVFFYKNISFFHKVKHVSTPSKKFYITIKGLKTLTTSLKATTVILSTSKGLLTHREALRAKVGGIILFIVS